jgi:outer membrane protein assembly factor BamD (BamD/ComL family)
MEKRILEKAQNKVEELVNNYQKPEGREEKLAKMREIINKAKKDLLN